MKGKSYSNSHPFLFSDSVIPLTTGLSDLCKLWRAYAQYTFLFVHLGMVGALLASVLWCLVTANLSNASSSPLADLPRLLVQELWMKRWDLPRYMLYLIGAGSVIVVVCAVGRYMWELVTINPRKA